MRAIAAGNPNWPPRTTVAKMRPKKQMVMKTCRPKLHPYSVLNVLILRLAPDSLELCDATPWVGMAGPVQVRDLD